MKANLLVPSGHNPSWLLDQDEGKRLYELLRVLPGTMMSMGHGSGYRGILVALDATERLTICKGLAEVVSGEEVRRFMDYNREMETWIFQTARGHIPDEIYNQILLSEFPT